MSEIHERAFKELDILKHLAVVWETNGLLLDHGPGATYHPINVNLLGVDPAGIEHLIAEGDHVVLYSRGYLRLARVYRVGRKNITVAYVTPGGIKDAERYTHKRRIYEPDAPAYEPNITVFTTPKTAVIRLDPKPGNPASIKADGS